MSDPVRWKDGGGPAGATDLLRRAPRAQAMTQMQRSRARDRVAKTALVPVFGSIMIGWVKGVAAAVGLGAASLVVANAVLPSKAPEAPAPVVAVAPRTAGPAQRRPAHGATQGAPPLVVDAGSGAEPSPVLAGVETKRPEASPLPPKAQAAAPAPAALRAIDPTPDPSAARALKAERGVKPPAAAPPVDELTREASLLESARALLERDPRAALAALDAHAAAFPSSQLAVERRLLRVQALARQGLVSEARATGAELLAQDPHGLYASRVRALVDGAGVAADGGTR